MSIPASYHGEAVNPVPDSENRIHSDEVARAYGFRGGLVPGVTVSACCLHPAAMAWGRAFVERGRAHVVVHSPVYDGDKFEVVVENATDDAFTAVLVDEEGTRCATARASLPDSPGEPSVRRNDPVLARDADRPVASRAVMEALREEGLGAMPARFGLDTPMARYLRDAGTMAPVFRDEGLANPSFVLGLTNWVLAANVRMSPWLHLETESRHFRAIEPDTALVVEARVADLFEKKGHEFVDVDVDVYRTADDAAVAQVRLRAIYRMRGT